MWKKLRRTVFQDQNVQMLSAISLRVFDPSLNANVGSKYQET